MSAAHSLTLSNLITVLTGQLSPHWLLSLTNTVHSFRPFLFSVAAIIRLTKLGILKVGSKCL